MTPCPSGHKLQLMTNLTSERAAHPSKAIINSSIKARSMQCTLLSTCVTTHDHGLRSQCIPSFNRLSCMNYEIDDYLYVLSTLIAQLHLLSTSKRRLICESSSHGLFGILPRLRLFVNQNSLRELSYCFIISVLPKS
jgi:hypothetical protein